MNVRANRLPLVDSLRAIAALTVLLTHTAIVAGVSGNPHSPLSRYAQRLDVGVVIFFLISGLLLYRPFLLSRLDGRPAPATGPYAWRRFLRIIPAYWVALTITAIWVGTSALQYGVFTAHGAPLYYLLAQTYSPHTLSGGLTQAWTLTIEVAFYAFLPVYGWIQRRIPARTRTAVLRSEIIGLLVLIVISTIWKAVVLGGGSSHQIVVTPLLDALPSYFDQFAFGMGLALLSVWIELEDTTPRFVRIFDRFPGIAWLFAAIAFWFVATQIGLGGFFAPVNTHQYMESHWLYTAVALGLLLPAVVGDQTRGLPRRILRWPVLAWLGLISYGIYLWQIPVVAQLSRWHFGTHSVLYPWLWWSAGTLAMTAVIAAASYYLLERPILSFKHVFDKRPIAARGEATDEPAPARPLALVPDRGDQS